jgi:hypothetical protein
VEGTVSREASLPGYELGSRGIQLSYSETVISPLLGYD